jgi:TolA-binding protein
MSDSEFLSETEAQLVEESRSALAEARADGSLERLIAATTEVVLAANVAPAPPVSSTWRKLGGAGLAGVLALSTAGYVATRDDPPPPPVSAPAPPATPERPTATAAPPPPSRAHETVVAVDALPAAPHTTAPLAAAAPANVVTRERATPASSAMTAHAPQPPIDESAASLFRRANAARHGGDDPAAGELYRRLLDGHPETREAATARVIYGRMRLVGGDAREALAQFDAYLARSPDGTLAEQALVGRARSLRALDRRDEERAAWAAVLRAFPESASRSEALERGR